MCVNQKCMSVASLKIQGPTCPQDCNGNGVCNSLGHCHCKDGFAPPFCDYPGPGGSEDSGPASDPNGNRHLRFPSFITLKFVNYIFDFYLARRDIITAIYIIFLGVIPAIGIIFYLTFYTKHNWKFTWQKSPSTSYVSLLLAYFFKSSNTSSACKTGDGLRRDIPTISKHVTQYNNSNAKTSNIRERNLEIKPTGLISTTNHEAINNSTNINLNKDINNSGNPESNNGNKRRLSFKALRSSLKLNTNLKHSKKINESSHNLVCKTPESAASNSQFDNNSPDASFNSVRNLARQFDSNNSKDKITNPKC